MFLIAPRFCFMGNFWWSSDACLPFSDVLKWMGLYVTRTWGFYLYCLGCCSVQEGLGTTAVPYTSSNHSVCGWMIPILSFMSCWYVFVIENLGLSFWWYKCLFRTGCEAEQVSGKRWSHEFLHFFLVSEILRNPYVSHKRLDNIVLPLCCSVTRWAVSPIISWTHKVIVAYVFINGRRWASSHLNIWICLVFSDEARIRAVFLKFILLYCLSFEILKG